MNNWCNACTDEWMHEVIFWFCKSSDSESGDCSLFHPLITTPELSELTHLHRLDCHSMEHTEKVTLMSLCIQSFPSEETIVLL